MLNKQFLKTISVVCFSLVVLAGCRPEEQGRPLKYNAGIYPGGAPASVISEASLAELRQRARLQGGVSAGNGGGSAPSRSSKVRPPEPNDATKALQKRGLYQSGN